MLFAGLFSIVELLIVVFIDFIIKVWLKDDFTSEISYVSATMMAIICCLMIFNSVLSSVSNGTGKLRAQVVCFVLGALLKIPLSILGVYFLHSWNGVLLSNILCMSIYTIVQPIIYKKEIKL